ncbi:MAG: Fe-S cluster assembly ATPase SufC [Actinomycetota bacterium]|nr:Fe-S cluster assembly ATPase SufC [Actinomycetota bacterium]
MSLLEVKDLHVKVGDKEILRGVDLAVKKGEVHVVMGPNASGKTTLIMTLLGYPGYRITQGEIVFNGVNFNEKPIHERVASGLFIAFQTPPEIRGVKLRDLIRIAGGRDPWDPLEGKKETIATPLLEKVGLDPATFFSRDVNVGFSGGEKKRSELAQIFAARPKLMVLDEPDSGVDIDSLKTLGLDLGDYIRENNCAALVITHYRHILPYIRPDKASVMCHGRVIVTGDPYEIFSKIEEKGYCEYLGVCPPDMKSLVEREKTYEQDSQVEKGTG